MSTPDQSTLDLTDDVEKALEAWMRTRKAIRISAAWRAGVEWGRAHPETSEKASASQTPLSEKCPKCSTQMFNWPGQMTKCSRCLHEWYMDSSPNGGTDGV